ncbi:hypothetical protein [Lactococcus petauri]|uniref:hypothetical protein n=1 Tax=Lactococcus petauri TaxID=1940789 RepID=UPI0020C12803|nr:hypothetical protein [Lactococcus petauri]UQU61196.1 hypothetical protein lgb_01999 [Lactococcus petauri]WJE12796.1 hypothetical protein QR692_11805 [Lactococcus petauri]
MNYHELADALHRPYNTVRKWRGEIAAISGIDFERIKVRNGRGRKNRTTYDFSSDDLENFKKLNALLQSGTSKIEAITQIFGNEKREAENAKADELLKVKVNINLTIRKIKHLEEENKELKSELSTLHRTLNALTNRVQALENKSLKNIFKK